MKIVKNYLSEIELQRLNLLVSQFLDYAEFQALEQRAITMNDWIDDVLLQNLLVENGLAETYMLQNSYKYAGMLQESVSIVSIAYNKKKR